MPIKIPDQLPARHRLLDEGVMVMKESDATRQDIRPLKIALLNLMPLKETTELQIGRLLGATPLQLELTLLTTSSYTPGNISAQHLLDFYQSFDDIKQQKFDGLIVTGAPVEKLPFEDVAYWDELCAIFEWSKTHVHSLMGICWGAQAALNYFHQIPKHALAQKRFGVFCHQVTRPSIPLLRGFDDAFIIPVSRHTETRAEDVLTIPGLEVAAESPQSGVGLIHDAKNRRVYMLNHLEYDAETLNLEYQRDCERGSEIKIPENYFPENDPHKPPENRWRAHAHLFVSNWINEVYQTTPYVLDEIGQ